LAGFASAVPTARLDSRIRRFFITAPHYVMQTGRILSSGSDLLNSDEIRSAYLGG
jgi:hypothetical protein